MRTFRIELEADLVLPCLFRAFSIFEERSETDAPEADRVESGDRLWSFSAACITLLTMSSSTFVLDAMDQVSESSTLCGGDVL